MKNKRLLVFSLLFFAIITTQYYWEGIVGAWSILIIFLLFLSFLVLLIAFFYQLVLSIAQKFRSRERSMVLTILGTILLLTVYRPTGLINFNKLEGEDLLIAQREGAANCMIRLKLKENGKFEERTVCFGIEKTTGTYSVKNDTIWFSAVSRSNEFYRFGRVATDEKGNEEILLFNYKKEPKPLVLFIKKNSLSITAGTKEQNVVFDLNPEQKDSLPFYGKLNDSLLTKFYPGVLDSIKDVRIVASDLLEMHPGRRIYVSLLHNTGTFDQMILCTHDSNFSLLDNLYIGKATMYDKSNHTIKYGLLDESTLQFNHSDWGYMNKGEDLEIGVLEYESYIIKVNEYGQIKKVTTDQ